MNKGDKVELHGIWASARVACDDEECTREHYDHAEIGRYHYEDGPSEQRPATFLADEAKGRIAVVLADGTVVSTEAANVKAVK